MEPGGLLCVSCRSVAARISHRRQGELRSGLVPRVVLFLAVSSGALALGSVANASDGATSTLAELRAAKSYALMQRYFYAAGTRSYNGTYPRSGRAQVWPYSQVLSATLAIARLPDSGHRARAALLARIARLAVYQAPLGGRVAYAPVYGGKGNPFYDDNAWIGIELVDAADLLDRPAYIVGARRLFAWVARGWDTKGPHCRGGVYWLMPGGKYWDRSPGSRYRAAVSTVNAALLASLLYQHTGRRGYLDWAERAYRWSQHCLGTDNGLIADHIDASGAVTTAIHSYNQGAMVATAVNLYRITHQRSYLAGAVRTADASLALFRDPLGSGDEPVFLAIFYDDLLQLMPIARGQVIRRAITDFGDRAWAEARDPTTGLFHFGHTKATLLDQAAMVQVYARLAVAGTS